MLHLKNFLFLVLGSGTDVSSNDCIELLTEFPGFLSVLPAPSVLETNKILARIEGQRSSPVLLNRGRVGSLDTAVW